MTRNSGAHPGDCALDGCEVPVVQRPGGGRPRLYCSDAHRAEARRRRLGRGRTLSGTAGPGWGSGSEPGEGLEAVRSLLDDAIASLERVQAAGPGDQALVATIRAEATAEVLRAQQAAADAARHAAGIQERLTQERGEWQRSHDALSRERAEHLHALAELTGALEGARSELEQELLRHHDDAERAESLLHAQHAAHAAEAERMAAELHELRRHLAGAQRTAEQADQRAARAELQLAERASASVDLEVRVARADEHARQASVRLEEAREELSRLKKELADERRHHRAVEAELRQVLKRAPAPAARTRRRTVESAVPALPARASR